RPRRRVRGPPRPQRPHPSRRPRRLAARLHRHARGQRRIPHRPRGGRPPMTDTQSPAARPARTATLSRTTRESSLELTLDIDVTGQLDVSTTVPFCDHILPALVTPARFDLTVKATGDTNIDALHTVEDAYIVLGQSLREALGDKTGIA